eukprot:35157-Chlamydomonas_euryale.AAC.2
MHMHAVAPQPRDTATLRGEASKGNSGKTKHTKKSKSRAAGSQTRPKTPPHPAIRLGQNRSADPDVCVCVGGGDVDPHAMPDSPAWRQTCLKPTGKADHATGGGEGQGGRRLLKRHSAQSPPPLPARLPNGPAQTLRAENPPPSLRLAHLQAQGHVAAAAFDVELPAGIRRRSGIQKVGRQLQRRRACCVGAERTDRRM